MNISDVIENGNSMMLGNAPDSDDNLALFPIDLTKLNEILGNNSFVFAFSMIMRPGNALFQRYLELKYFHPETEDNKLMVCIFHKWQDMLWSITGVPRKWKGDNDEIHDGESYLKEAIEYAGMRIVKDGYVPLIIGGDNPDVEFEGIPANAPLFDMTNVFYLENKSDHLVYTDRDAASVDQAAKIAELEEQYL